MAAQAEIKAVITADDRASATLSKFGSTLGGIGGAAKVAAVGIVAATAAVAAFGVSSLNAFQESQDAAAQLGAVLKSTGGVAGVSADMANDLAKSLQNVTRFSDEAILGGENMLLTFTNIGKDIFPQATETILNMSTALGQDLKGSAIQLGKALNDPIQGVTALRRVGVQFNDAQEEVIKNLVASGDLMGAQKMILKELETEFGNSAKAAGQTFGGQLDILKNKFNDLQEKIGEGIAKAISPFVKKISDFVSSEGFSKWADEAGTKIGNFFVSVGQGVMTVMPTLISAFNEVAATFRDWIIPAFIAVKDVIVDLYNQQPLIVGLTGAIIAFGLAFAVNPVITIIAGIITALTFLHAHWTTITTAVMNAWNTMTTWITNAWNTAFNAVSGAINYVKDHFFQIIGYMIGYAAALPIKLPIFFFQAFAAIIKFLMSINWGQVFDSLGVAFINILDWLYKATWKLFDKIKSIDWGSFFFGIGKGIANMIIDLIQGALNGALDGIPGAPKVSLPHFANGVENFAGGMAIVGERGPELVTLPRGSSVIPNGQMGTAVSQASNINISISGAFMGTPDEARSFARKIVDGMQDIANAKNTTVAEMLS